MMNFETIKNVFSITTNEINRRIKIKKRIKMFMVILTIMNLPLN